MPFEVIELHSQVDRLDLQVELAGMSLIVKAGAITYNGQERVLGEDESYTVAKAGVSVMAYLVIDTEDDSLHVLVDEFGEGEESYTFERGDRYQLLDRLVWGVVPKGVTDLSSLVWHKLKVSPVPEELEKEGDDG